MKTAVLTFDAGYDKGHYEYTLSMLAKFGFVATWFVTGKYVRKWPSSVTKINQAGHHIENHSNNHERMSDWEVKDIVSDIQEVDDLLSRLNIKTLYFRPPFLELKNNIIRACKITGHIISMPNLCFPDWKKDSPIDEIKRRIDACIDDKIILCHNNSPVLEQYLEYLFNTLKDKKYKTVFLEDVMTNCITESYEGPHLVPLIRQDITGEIIKSIMCDGVIVRPRETLCGLFGDSNWRYVYNLEVNEGLRRTCPNPDTIQPGVSIFVPRRV